MTIVQDLRQWARRLKRDAVTLWFAGRHPRTPWYSKALAMLVVAYALSPIDLIPDFVPVLGYLDDVILLPGLIWLAIRTVPATVLVDCRAKADQWVRASGAKPHSSFGAAIVVGLWLVFGFGIWYWWPH